jgi:hypothetical protein
MAFLSGKLMYIKLRYIGVFGGAKESVRLVRMNRVPSITHVSNLQTKVHRTYFQEIIKLSKSGNDLSPITLDREQGIISLINIEVLRAAVPA